MIMYLIKERPLIGISIGHQSLLLDRTRGEYLGPRRMRIRHSFTMKNFIDFKKTENACYCCYSLQTLLSTRLLSKNFENIKKKIIILPVLLIGNGGW